MCYYGWDKKSENYKMYPLITSTSYISEITYISYTPDWLGKIVFDGKQSSWLHKKQIWFYLNLSVDAVCHIYFMYFMFFIMFITNHFSAIPLDPKFDKIVHLYTFAVYLPV